MKKTFSIRLLIAFIIVFSYSGHNLFATTKKAAHKKKNTFMSNNKTVKQIESHVETSLILNNDESIITPLTEEQRTETLSLKFDYSDPNQIYDRVSNWYANPRQAYDSNCIEHNKKNHNDDDYERMIKYHTFSKAVDFFIDPLAIKCAWTKNNAPEGSVSYNIPGQLIYFVKDDNQKTQKIVETGVFSYGVNQNGTLYHRSFSSTTCESIENEIGERINKKQNYDHELTFGMTKKEKDSLIKKKNKEKPIRNVNGYENCIKENELYFEIEDKENTMTVRLYKK